MRNTSSAAGADEPVRTRETSWPALSASRDGPTIATLHLFSQIIGKVAVALLPWRNHGWHLTLHAEPRGLRTEIIHGSGGPFQLALDLVEHLLVMEDAEGRDAMLLDGLTVAQFFECVAAMLDRSGHPARIHGIPNEIEPAIPFSENHEERIYDPDSARRLLAALLSADRIFRLFRSGFLGKASPVHFFWGSFDLAVTRFSGRRAPPHPGDIPNLPDTITREAYSHELSSAGFWPGGAGAEGEPFFYSYAYPAPQGFGQARVLPQVARFDTALGEFVLDYDAVRGSENPEETLLAFLQSSYEAAAELGAWDRAALEGPPGRVAVPRPV
ncbi:MAG TPA: DUF5996 family protein [Allosphingosinicella sp.]|nr:DUF5996 family protein [Allosphingosinicella sp.]